MPLEQRDGRGGPASSHAVHKQRPIGGEFGETLAQTRVGDIDGAWHVAQVVFCLPTHIEHRLMPGEPA